MHPFGNIDTSFPNCYTTSVAPNQMRAMPEFRGVSRNRLNYALVVTLLAILIAPFALALSYMIPATLVRFVNAGTQQVSRAVQTTERFSGESSDSPDADF